MKLHFLDTLLLTPGYTPPLEPRAGVIYVERPACAPDEPDFVTFLCPCGCGHKLRLCTEPLFFTPAFTLALRYNAANGNLLATLTPAVAMPLPPEACGHVFTVIDSKVCWIKPSGA